MAGVDDEALDEVGVLEEALPEEEVVLAHRHPLAPLVQDGPVEAVDLRRRHVALHRGPCFRIDVAFIITSDPFMLLCGNKCAAHLLGANFQIYPDCNQNYHCRPC